MYEICFTINGVRHCFPVPVLVDQNLIHRPPPNNFPELELAATVIQLAQVAGHSEFSKQLTDMSTRFIDQVAKQLPKGVELMKGHEAAAQGG